MATERAQEVHAVPATSGEGDGQLVCYGSRLQGGAGGETELTDSGEGGARSARSGVSERDARDIAWLLYSEKGKGRADGQPLGRRGEAKNAPAARSESRAGLKGALSWGGCAAVCAAKAGERGGRTQQRLQL
ncbi:hypothetical protein AK812_SmicGene41573, partial [Symbiodinium microadriaticum]